MQEDVADLKGTTRIQPCLVSSVNISSLLYYTVSYWEGKLVFCIDWSINKDKTNMEIFLNGRLSLCEKALNVAYNISMYIPHKSK